MQQSVMLWEIEEWILFFSFSWPTKNLDFHLVVIIYKLYINVFSFFRLLGYQQGINQNFTIFYKSVLGGRFFLLPVIQAIKIWTTARFGSKVKIFIVCFRVVSLNLSLTLEVVWPFDCVAQSPIKTLQLVSIKACQSLYMVWSLLLKHASRHSQEQF